MAKTILVVDDDAPIRACFTEILTNEGGFTVVTAKHGEEALELVAEGLAFDALLTDRRMPVMGGEELVAALRSRGCKQPMVLMTGDIKVPDAIPGVDLIVRKPFSIIELIEELQRRL